MQVKWGNADNSLNVTLEIGAASVGRAMIASLAMDHLRRSVTTNGSFGILVLFVNAIRHTTSAEGLPFELLKWNSRAEDIDVCFAAWQALPEALGDVWTDAVDEFRGKGGAAQSGDGSPLSQTVNSALSTNTPTPNSTVSAKLPKRQRNSRGTRTDS